MSDGNWSVRVAIIGALACLIFTSFGSGVFFDTLYSQQNSGEQTVASNSGQTYPASSPRNGLADVAGIDRIIESAIAKPQPRNTDEREQRDLAAQESMAVFAYWMFWAMMLQTALAGGALVALVKDLRQNRRSAEAQLRPYIQLKTKTFPEAHRLGKEGSNIPIHVVNKGQTPALNVEQWSQSFIAPYPLKEGNDIPSDWVYAGKGAVVHSQSDEHDFGLKFTNLAEHDLGGFVRETSERATALYIAAKVLYTDHFGRSYVEQYCASVHYPNGSLVRTEIAPFGNVST